MGDVASNHKLMLFKEVAEGAVGAATVPSTELDLHTNGLAGSVLVIIDVTAVATSGTLKLVFEDSPDDSTYDADYVTLPIITAVGQYYAVLDNPNRYLRVKATVGTAKVTWGAYGITFDEKRRPVTQTFTKCAATYGTGRVPNVATS